MFYYYYYYYFIISNTMYQIIGDSTVIHNSEYRSNIFEFYDATNEHIMG